MIELEYEDANRIINAFEPDYYVPHGRVRDAISRKFMFNVIHQETAFKIDLVIKKQAIFRNKRLNDGEKSNFTVKRFML